MRPSVPALLLALALAAPAPAQEAPAEIALDPDQNFAAEPEGTLRIVGDEARYDIVLPADILFDFDEAALRPDAEPLLAELRAHFEGVEPDQVHVRGHTDAKGTDEYNLTLSIDRATAVCGWLKANTSIEMTNCIGRGEMEPLVPNEDAGGADLPENRQLNRRVTVSVVIYPDANAMIEAARAEADAALGTLGEPAAGTAAAPDAGALLEDAGEAAAEALDRLNP